MEQSQNKDFSQLFPETGWLCPYCMHEATEEKDALIDRHDIPGHLIYQHGWENGSHMNWEYIYTRLAAVGGV